MGVLIIILRLTLLLSSFGFTQSSELLHCFNDYDTELKCSLSLPETSSCSEHKLSASVFMIPKVRYFKCNFDEIRLSACECIMIVQGFVPREIFTINVLKGDKVWHTENISTEASIKPRKPIIMSVIQKINNDFWITLNTTYTKEVFSKSLMVELTYGIDGSNDKVTKLLEAGCTAYEIVSRNLQPNSKYILRARVKSSYPPNITFSDYSEPYVFETPPSLQSILKIIIPILCLILIICITSIYIWLDRFLKPWWDKIPTPKLSTNFVKQVPWLLSFQNEPSVGLDSTANNIGKKTECKSECSPIHTVESDHVQFEGNFYSSSVGKDIDSASLTCIMSRHEWVDKNSSENDQYELNKEHRSTNTKNEQSNESSTGISNKSYSPSNFLLLSKKLEPRIYMDNEYSTWNGCTDSGSSKLIQITRTDSETQVVLGYHSVYDHDDLSSSNNSVTEEPFSGKRLQNVPSSIRDSIMPMEEGYQGL